jgi:hypothetical protein
MRCITQKGTDAATKIIKHEFIAVNIIYPKAIRTKKN